MLTRYSERVEARKQNFYCSLSEKDRRRYAAVEAEKIGYGGVTYASELFGCDAKTIQSGIDGDIDHLTDKGCLGKGCLGTRHRSSVN